MPTPTYLSLVEFPGDGVTTEWDFNFAGGYISRDHVKALSKDAAGVTSTLELTPSDFITDTRLRIIPAVALGHTLRIYRDTPREQPLVNFTGGSNFTEANLDVLARQSVFIAAEAYDVGDYAQVNDLVGQALTAAVQAQGAASDAAAAVVVAEDAAEAAATFDPAAYVPKVGDSTIDGNVTITEDLLVSGDTRLDAGAYITTAADMGNLPSNDSTPTAHAPAFRNGTADAPTFVGAVANGAGSSAGLYAQLNGAQWGGITVDNSAVKIRSSASNSALPAPPIRFTFKGVDRAGVSSGGVVDCYGVRGRQGTAGGAIGNAINLYWTGAGLEVWVDSTRLGTVNITP